MKKLLLLLFICFVFITGCSEKSKMISTKEVNEIIENYKDEDDVYIIDVREKEEYDNEHIGLAINISVNEINKIKDIKEIKKTSKIIVYCRSGNRSKVAQSKLYDMGYTNVYDMGGIIDWPYTLHQDIYVEG